MQTAGNDEDLIPVDRSAAEAACDIFNRLPRLPRHDDILRRAALAFREPTYEDTLARVVLLNQLYGTNLYAVNRMADHIATVHSGLTAPDSRLVESIAALPDLGRVVQSFASKYAHFFIDPEKFHILDDAALTVLSRHARVTVQGARKWSYTVFNDTAEKLRSGSGLPANRSLDRYLWIAGMHLRWQRASGARRVNRELRTAFKDLRNQGDLELLMRAIPPPPKRRPPARSIRNQQESPAS